MEMKPEDLKKYQLRHPSPEPKHGRFAPHGQFFLCETADQVAKLEAAGWGTNPLAFDPPYAPEDAVLVEKWKNVKLTAEPVAPSAPAVDTSALQSEVERLQAELAMYKATANATNDLPAKIGRPRKVA